MAKLFELLTLFGQSAAYPELSWINFKKFFHFWTHLKLPDVLFFFFFQTSWSKTEYAMDLC